MAKLFPSMENILRLTVKPTEGELYFLEQIIDGLDDTFEVFFNPYLDGDRPDIIILKKDCGAIIVEIKDWNFNHYEVNEANAWLVRKNGALNKIKSPFQQVFHYKKNMFELHLPVLGIKEAINKNFYKVIDVYVYFHLVTVNEMESFYKKAIEIINNDIDENIENFKSKKTNHLNYQKRDDYLKSKKRQLERDKNTSVLKNSIDKAIKKIKSLRPNILFNDQVYDDFKRRLSPPENMLLQGTDITLDKKQMKLSESNAASMKIKGVAGSGKTTILAKRAVNSFLRHNCPVLILTYNITLKPFIRDSVNRFVRNEQGVIFEISNYHQFINSMLNEYNISIKEFINEMELKGKTTEEIFEAIYKNRSFYDGVEIQKYKTILIDEVQDYESDWVKIIRDFFLDGNGEMVLFGDQGQNIYQRDEKKRESSIAQGFGKWQILTRSHRLKLDTPLVDMFKKFKQTYFEVSDDPVFDSMYEQGSMNFNLLSYEQYGSTLDFQNIFNLITQYIRSYNLVPNDVSIICSRIHMVKAINELFLEQEKTMTMVETSEEVSAFTKVSREPSEDDIQKIRRRKKTFFEQNSGLIKISTVHSFKGMEAGTVFYIRYPGCGNDPEDDPEMIYTAITRSRGNLVIFDNKDSNYREFFNNAMNS